MRIAAIALLNSKSALGAYLRRQKARLGAPKAITATAHKLARLVYMMLKQGTAYVDAGQEYYEKRCRGRVVQNLDGLFPDPYHAQLTENNITALSQNIHDNK